MSKIKNQVDDVVEVDEDSLPDDVVEVATPVLTVSDGIYKNSGDVEFVVDYPKNYEGQKNMEQGSIHIVSRESAEHFVKLGIGKIKK